MKHFLVLITLILSQFTFSQDIDIIPYRKGDKWGYANTKGQLVVEPIYDSVSTLNHWFHEPAAYIFKDGYQGMINRSKKVIIEPNKYNELRKFNSKAFLPEADSFSSFITKQGNQYGLISNQESLYLKPQFDEIVSVEKVVGYEEYNGMRFDQWKAFLWGRKGDQWFSINGDSSIEPYNQEPEIKTEEEEIFATKENYTSTEKEAKEIPNSLKRKIDRMSNDGSQLEEFFSRYDYNFIYKKNKVGLIHTNNIASGNIDILPQYDEIITLVEPFVVVRNKKEIIVINIEDKTVLWSDKAEFVNDFSYGYTEGIIYKKCNTYGLYFTNTNIDTTNKYTNVNTEDTRNTSTYHKQALIKVQTKKGWGFINDKGFEYFED